MTCCEVMVLETGGHIGREAFLAGAVEGGTDWEPFIDCWLRDERRKWYICPADVFCSNTARASIVRFEITACASCINKKILGSLFIFILTVMLKTVTKLHYCACSLSLTHVFQERNYFPVW